MDSRRTDDCILCRGGIWSGNFRATIHLMASDGRYIRQLSDGDNARDFEPDISPLGLAVSPTSNIKHNLGPA